MCAAHGVTATIWCKDGSLKALNDAGAFKEATGAMPYTLPTDAALASYHPDWSLATAQIDFVYNSGATLVHSCDQRRAADATLMCSPDSLKVITMLYACTLSGVDRHQLQLSSFAWTVLVSADRDWPQDSLHAETSWCVRSGQALATAQHRELQSLVCSQLADHRQAASARLHQVSVGNACCHRQADVLTLPVCLCPTCWPSCRRLPGSHHIGDLHHRPACVHAVL